MEWPAIKGALKAGDGEWIVHYLPEGSVFSKSVVEDTLTDALATAALKSMETQS